MDGAICFINKFSFPFDKYYVHNNIAIRYLLHRSIVPKLLFTLPAHQYAWLGLFT